jgi:hypothetical protein
MMQILGCYTFSTVSSASDNQMTIFYREQWIIKQTTIGHYIYMEFYKHYYSSPLQIVAIVIVHHHYKLY